MLTDHNIVGNRKPQPCALIRFGREKGIKDSTLDLWRDADAIIANPNFRLIRQSAGCNIKSG